jgi:hypothetical protein
MVEIGPLPEDLKLIDEDWQKTPSNIRRLVIYLLEEIARLTKRIEELEAKLRERSDTSHRPPSTDSPFTKRNLNSHPASCGIIGRLTKNQTFH